MGYDLAGFKQAFGYKTAVVGKLNEALKDKLSKDPSNLKLQELQQAMELQHKLLDKSSKAEAISGKENKSFLDELTMRPLQKDILLLRGQLDQMEAAGPQLKMLEELHTLEQQLASTPTMLAGLVKKNITKLKQLMELPAEFTTLVGSDESEAPRKSREEIMRGGGELEPDKQYDGDDGHKYTVASSISGGGHSAFKLVDEKGNAFLWKPSASSMMLEAEVGSSQLGALLMPGLVPPCTSVKVNGLDGTCQPFVEGADDNVKIAELTEDQQQQMMAHMLTDFVISNHDNHLKQFLFDKDKNLIGIDKGQAFKFFKSGEIESATVKIARQKAVDAKDNTGLRDRALGDVEPETLDPNYFPSSNIGMPVGRDFIASMQTSMKEPDFTTGPVAKAIKSAEKLTLEDLRKQLGSYAAKAFPGQEEEFLAAVLERAHGMRKQLESLQCSAPSLAKQQTKVADELLDGNKCRDGEYPKLAKAIGPMRTAIMRLKKVDGILSATAPTGDEEPDPKYALKLQLQKLEADYAKLAKIDDDCKACEQYLSGTYMRVSPLLAAFEALKVPPSVHHDPDYDYTPIEGSLIPKWKEIAVERSMASREIAELWDERELKSTYEIVRSMQRVWDAFPVPEIPGNKVTRGDVADNVLKNYSNLDPELLGLEDGEHTVSIQIAWPGVMSTTVGDPKQHSYIQKKSFIWAFDVAQPCPGRVIGDINPSEQEVTFAAGVKVSVNKLIVRKANKDLQKGEYGSVAEVIAIAGLG